MDCLYGINWHNNCSETLLVAHYKTKERKQTYSIKHLNKLWDYSVKGARQFSESADMHAWGTFSPLCVNIIASPLKFSSVSVSQLESMSRECSKETLPKLRKNVDSVNLYGVPYTKAAQLRIDF